LLGLCRCAVVRPQIKYRSLLVGVATETALVGLIVLVHWYWHLQPLPMHPVTLVSALTPLPGLILYLPLMVVEPFLSEPAGAVLEVSAVVLVFAVQAEEGSVTIRAEVGEWPHWIGRNVRQWKVFQKK
jgi:hypothetical protein